MQLSSWNWGLFLQILTPQASIMPCCSSHKLHMQNIRPAALPRMLDVVSSSGNWKGYSGPSKPFSYPQVLRSCLQLALCTRTVCELLVCVAAERRRGLQQARDSSIYPTGRRYVHILAILSPQISNVIRCWYQKGARHGQVTQTLCSCWKKELRYPGLDSVICIRISCAEAQLQ